MTDTPLPATDDAAAWPAVHRAPLERWLPLLADLCARHQLAERRWQRAPFGKNLVFLGDEHVVKLAPPLLAGDLAGEAAALAFVAGRLPVATPAVVACGALGDWAYLVQTRLPGEPLRQHWPALATDERTRLAHAQGALMAALHPLPVVDAPPQLAFDWQAMLAEQRADCAASLRDEGLTPCLLDSHAAFLAAAPCADHRPAVLLHGDLTAGNLLVERDEDAGGWRISALVDWGDARLGPWPHELISPAVHQFADDPAARDAWLVAYQLTAPLRTRPLRHELMARVLLYYSDAMAAILARAGASAAPDWDAVGERLWWRLTSAVEST